MYFKLIYNGFVIDALKSPQYIKFSKYGHVSLSDHGSAQGVVGSDRKTPYRFSGFATETSFKEVSMVPITELEYTQLSALLGSGRTDIPGDNLRLYECKKAKIAEMSAICSDMITKGFSVLLSDNYYHNFRLTIEDQLNLYRIENQLLAGETSFVYHETNSPCQVYSKEDITIIVNASKNLTLYHTTYFNVLKQYINARVSVSEVEEVYYDMDILDEVADTSIKALLADLRARLNSIKY